STSVAIMQLYEQGKLQFDDPVVKYLPEFAAAGKSNITIRQLLTHYSGLAPDVSLKDAWSGKAEGVKRAMESVPAGPPGVKFVYSDINFITLGAIVEKLSGEPQDVYAAKHIFGPLKMTETGYFTPHCPHLYWQPAPATCAPVSSAAMRARIAPTAHNDDKPMDDDRMLRGEVHDPTTRRMGGVAGHAGVFSTVHDTELFVQALMDRLAGRPSNFPLKTETLRLMCQPEQPTGAKGLRGFGWDIDSPYSRPRGTIYPVGSFGHTGFTGTSIWMDPHSDSYVILLANAVHPRGRKAITPLRGQIASAVAKALGVDKPLPGKMTLSGIDVLEQTNFQALHALAAKMPGHLRIGLLTNNTGLDRTGKRTIDVLYAQRRSGIELTTLFAPEHGILGTEDHEGLGNATDAATHLPVISLYGAKLADRYPKVEDLQKLDAVLIDLQDVPARFYTYETEMGYVMESAAKAGTQVVVLDRPAMTSGVQVVGPVADAEAQSYIDYMQEPMSLGLTMGELAGFFNGEKQLGVKLSVVKMQNWQRGLWYDQTGLPWVNPSPNLQNMSAATLYTGTAFAEITNLSVGRGTDAAFEQVGAAWIVSDAEAKKLADTLNARAMVGVTFAPVTFTPAKPYPYAGQTIHGVRATVTDRSRLDAPAMGAELLAAVHAQYPTQFQMAKAQRLVLNQATIDGLVAGKDPHEIVAAWEPELWKFREARQKYLLYSYLPE
ncbi:MAG TPA: exo-beta-N-acetylmuramidase NamZ domain-containing protein, partial [Terriglobus sp.]